MLVKFIFLILCSLSMAHLDLNEGNLVSKPLRALDLPAKKKENFIERLISQFPNRFFFSEDQQIDLPSSSQERYLSPEKRAEIKEKWVKNQDQLISLQRDFNEISSIESDLNRKILKLKILKRFHLTFYDAQKISKGFELLQEINQRLAIFVELRFLELGGIDLPISNLKLMSSLLPNIIKEDPETNEMFISTHLPHEIMQLITKKSWITLGNSIVEEINTLMTDDSLSYDKLTRTIFQFWWKWCLKSIDFLFKNGLTDQSVVRNFFQHHNIIKQVIYYIELCFKHDLQDTIVSRSSSLTQHWYWPILHDSFRAIGEKEERIFEACFLLEHRFEMTRELWHMNSDNLSAPAWREFFDTFDSQEYFKTFLALNNLESSVLMQEKKLLSHVFQRRIRKDVKKIIDLIAISSDETATSPNPEQVSQVTFFMCDMLDFIETFISPTKLFHSALFNHPLHEEFDNNFNVLKMCSKMCDIFWKASEYYEFIQRQKPSKWSISKVYKLKIDHYLAQASQIRQQFKEEVLRLKEKVGITVYESQYSESVNELDHNFQDIFSDLRRMSRSFSPRMTH